LCCPQVSQLPTQLPIFLLQLLPGLLLPQQSLQQLLKVVLLHPFGSPFTSEKTLPYLRTKTFLSPFGLLIGTATKRGIVPGKHGYTTRQVDMPRNDMTQYRALLQEGQCK
jgi:hypothetical protein